MSKPQPTPQPTFLDRVISYVSPMASLRREVARTALSNYRGTVSTRLSRPWEASTSMTGQRLPRQQDQRSARDRARALERKNPIAAGALDRCVENIIGTGIQIEPRTESEEFNAEASDFWENWKKTCDVRGIDSYDEMQRKVFRSQLRDGDVLIKFVDDGFDGKLQPIEGDYIKSPPGKYTNGLTIDGVELNATGRPSKFWIESVDEKYKTTYTSIDADFAIFLANRDRLSDIRGMTRFITTFDMFEMILGYFEDTVTMSRIATWYTIFLKKKNPVAATAGLPSMTNSGGQTQKYVMGEPGQVMVGGEGDEPMLLNPGMPNQSFPEALAAFVRPVGLAFGIPLEQLLFDWSRANYTVSRAIKMQIQRSADILQQNFADRNVSRTYQWVISKAVKNGRIRAQAPLDFWKHEWIPQPLALVDPVKEIAAAAAAVELGVDARTFIARGMGYRFTTVVKQNKADRELMAAAGLPVDTNKAAPQINQAAQQIDTQNQQDTQQPAQTATARLMAMLPEHYRENP